MSPADPLLSPATMSEQEIPHQLASIYAAYQVLESRVKTALLRQLGDVRRLNEIRSEVFHLASAADQVCFAVIYLSLSHLI